ncbi:MAG: DNA primase [Synergistaceae bacterium]|nr:DNA primase [Synergistaceae bacterium]
MPADNNELYNEIKNALDIIDIIGERVRLRRTGRGYMGLCPFHNEKTPSFHVWPDSQSYYCFGCHEGGNIFTFIMKTEGMTFPEALEFLAGRAGVDISKYKSRNRTRNNTKSLYDILELSAKFFTDNLLGTYGSAARDYMKRRELTDNDINTFSLGYSLNSWNSLITYLTHSGIPERDIINCGLAVENRNGAYDRFRGRLIFPVRDIAGRVIAFGGRIIDSSEGVKYINSPESDIYSKRRNLYLLHEARKFIREKGRSILTEGYMDAVRLHKCGFKESVASLGTSLTPEQAGLLSRFADRCYICYDSDQAGKNAALRGMYILQEHGLDVRVINLPDDKAKDPDEFLCSHSPEEFEEAVKNSKPLILQHIETLRPALNDSSSRKNALNELFEGLSKLSLDEALQYRSAISEVTFIPPSELERRLIRIKNDNARNSQTQTHNQTRTLTPNQTQSQSQTRKSLHDDSPEAGLCALLMRNRECRLMIKPQEVFDIFSSELAQDTALAILTGSPDELESSWLSLGDTDKTGFIAKGDEFCRQSASSGENLTPSEQFRKIYSELKRNSIERRIKSITAKLLRGQADDSELQELGRLQKMKDKYIL